MAALVSNKQPWSSGLCDCFSDCGICCYTCCCLPCSYGSTARDIDGGNCCGHCCLYYLASMVCANACVAACTRKKLRETYNLDDPTCGNCCAHFWCGPCAISQDAREVRYRRNQQAQFATAVAVTAAPQQQYMVPLAQPAQI